MNLIVKCVFGSHLYGTATEASDHDFKGVYLPSVYDLLLQKAASHISKNEKISTGIKNSSDDTDFEIVSVHEFLKLAINGDTMALDMLHAPREMLEVSSPEWEFLHNQRAKFYSKNLKSFIGYARSQASKYGCKGSRLNTAEQVIALLKTFDPKAQLGIYWDVLPALENTSKGLHAECRGEDKRYYEVCSKKLMATTPVAKCLSTLEAFYAAYGARAKDAAANSNIDWKAVSHAFRAAYQVQEILETGDLVYPLRQADFLKELKAQNTLAVKTLHYKEDGIGAKLDELVESVNAKLEASSLPERVNVRDWDEWLFWEYSNRINQSVLTQAQKTGELWR